MVLTDCSARPRNAANTRVRILESARELFSHKGYDEVGMRDIGREAGVDAALVSRYFGSKEDLFAEVLRSCGDAKDWFEGDRTDFGRELAYELVYDPSEMDDCKLDGLLIMLRSMGSQKAAEIIRQSTHERFYAPFIKWLGGEDVEVRSRMVLGVLMGMALSRDMAGGYGLSEEDTAKLCERLAVLFQNCIDGDC
ncbi:TetR/AcrR family transcriptional regulator [Brevundimonas sp. BAL450]|uniref:TetR/AcrR family transcriptional regulator n=1 Tax=Brevundimonas abyssalis TaxID=1125965 RepID=UPI000697F8B9|nr:TetR/AcrR family transcriptional regulator [Brevundimonas abyssalis]MBG7616589.1 TetR/AcrR family transcriptional regulator [Brevundimonas sp. BAL450]